MIRVFGEYVKSCKKQKKQKVIYFHPKEDRVYKKTNCAAWPFKKEDVTDSYIIPDVLMPAMCMILKVLHILYF